MSMNARQRMQRKQILAVAVFCIIITPYLTNSITVAMSKSTSLQDNETIWKEIEHEFIRNDVMPWDIAFRNVTHGWALSQNRSSLGRGIILHSNDSGNTWHLQLYNQTTWFKQIEFVDESVWVAAEGGLFHSIDDGLNWDYVHIGSDRDYFQSIHFYNDTYGWTGSNLGIYKTDDGGNTWFKISTWQFGGNPSAIHFTTPTNGWIMGSFGIYHSIDGGENWERMHSKGGWTFSFISDTEAWAVGDDMLAHMTDGNTWVEQPHPPTGYSRLLYFTDVYFLNSSHGWVVGREPMVAHTQNGGIDWYEQSVPVDTRVNAVCFINESLGWAICYDGNILRTDRGNELETYLWSTSGSNVAIYIVVAIVTVVIGSLGLLVFMKKRRYKMHQPSQPLNDPMLE
ncbi:MAG: YCF48-related protein [Candidatus Thorarchaeota archaeon]